MRTPLIILISLLWTALYFGQSSREHDFAVTLERVVHALSERDSVTLSRYIDKKFGVYILGRVGIQDTYWHVSALGFFDTSYPNAPFYDGVRLTPLRYSTLPTFNCDTFTKTGTFVDTTQRDHLLSKIAKKRNREFNGKIPRQTVNEFYNLENKSRRIVIAKNDSNELIIYLTLIKDKWVLTIIDKATCDCSV